MEKKKENNICGLECEVYSRIVGYYRPVQSWNKGKEAEFSDRIIYKNDNPLERKGGEK